jgi:hypothetical protein
MTTVTSASGEALGAAPGEATSLKRNQSGAIMVMGVFMAALMVGFIYYVKGIGDAILFRERMQDAADSGAFSAVAVHARGMNLIALLNITMVSVLAVVTAFRLLAILSALAAFPILICSFGGADQLLDDSKDLEETYVRPLFSVLRAGNTAANAVVTAIPIAAEAYGIDAATNAFTVPVDTAFPYPTFYALPVVPSSLADLTQRAGTAALPLLSKRLDDGTIDCFDDHFANRGGLIEVSIEAAMNIMAIIDNPTTLSGMVPQKLLDDAVLSGPRFQRGVLTAGEFDFGLSEQGLEVATWGQTEAAEEVQRSMQEMSRIAVANGEFFYVGPGGRDESLWNQQWRARLRRVRLGDPGGYPCEEVSDICDALDEMYTRDLHNAMVH